MWKSVLAQLMYVPAVWSICPSGEGEVLVRIQTDGGPPNDDTYWQLLKNGRRGLIEVERVSLDSPFTEYETSVCIKPGEYTWDIFDSGGDGLCFQGDCGTLNVRVDGIPIITDQLFENSLSIPFNYPLCPVGEGVFVVNVGIRSNNFCYRSILTNNPNLPWKSIADKSLGINIHNDNNIRCIRDGEWLFGFNDCGEDGLCWDGNCGDSESQGALYVAIDGTTIADGQDLTDQDGQIERTFDYPFECIDEYGPHTVIRRNGNPVAFTCLMLENACEEPTTRMCQRKCGRSLDGALSQQIKDVCRFTCGECA